MSNGTTILWHAEPISRLVKAAGVHLGAKQGYPAVSPFVRLEPLEDLLGVEEDHTRRVKCERLIWLDSGIAPPLPGPPFDQQHPVGEIPAETES